MMMKLGEFLRRCKATFIIEHIQERFFCFLEMMDFVFFNNDVPENHNVRLIS